MVLENIRDFKRYLTQKKIDEYNSREKILITRNKNFINNYYDSNYYE